MASIRKSGNITMPLVGGSWSLGEQYYFASVGFSRHPNDPLIPLKDDDPGNYYVLRSSKALIFWPLNVIL